MKKMISSLVLLLAAGPLSVLAVTPDQPAQTGTPTATAKPGFKDLFEDTVIAKGKGVEVKRSQLDDALISIKSTAAARGQTIPPEQLAQVEQQVLDRLIQIQLLLARATEADLAKGKETGAKRFETVRTRAGSEEALNRQLKSVGMSQEELRSKMVEEATAEAVVERELKVNVTDEDVKKFYDDNPSRFEQPEMVRASHILLGTRDPATGAELAEDKKNAKRKQMEDILKRAKTGEDFGKLAKDYSEDPGSKDKGGELLSFPRGQMVPEFEAAAFSLNTNQISDIVTTQYGYHIIKLSEKIPAKKMELAKLAPDIKERLKQEAMQKLIPNYMEKMKKDNNVEILDEKLKKQAAAAPTLPQPLPSAGK